MLHGKLSFELIKHTTNEFIRGVVCNTKVTNDVPLYKVDNFIRFENCIVILDAGYCTQCQYNCSHVLYCIDNVIKEDQSKKKDVLEFISYTATV